MIPLKLTPSSVLAQVGKGCGSVGGSGGSGGGARDILMFEERAATSMAAKTCLFIEDASSALVALVACFLFFSSLFLSDGPLPLFVAALSSISANS